MARKEITNTRQASDKKLQTKDLIYAGAFGAIYIVLMFAIVMGSGMIPILYILSPLTVGVVCASVYELCVLKVHKFGAALILGVLFALVAASSNIVGLILAVIIALIAELIIKAGGYKSKKMFLLSFVIFNLNMVCPFSTLVMNREAFFEKATGYYGQAYADKVAALTPSWIIFVLIGLALLGGMIGAAIANRLINKHFAKAGIV